MEKEKRLTDLSYIREIMQEHHAKFQKKFGQNFLCEAAVPQRIAQECGASKKSGILEIGPGIGCLTQCLCERFSKVVAVEIDADMIRILHKTLAHYTNLTVLHTDIMQTDLPTLVQQYFADMPVSVCANLPYYITTPVLLKLLESRVPFDYITVMVQKEVARRLCAVPGTPDYGAVTASVSYYASVRRLFDVSAGCFIPRPKVDSSVICLSVYRQPPVHTLDEKILFRVIRAAFAQRRKTLLNALAAAFHTIPKEKLAALLTAQGFHVQLRGEQLSLEEFCQIANAISAYGI